MSFLKFWSRWSFLGYGIYQKNVSDYALQQQLAEAIDENDTLTNSLESVKSAVTSVNENFTKRENAFAARPNFTNGEEFLGSGDMNPSQTRQAQLRVLRLLQSYDNAADNEINEINQLNDVKQQWLVSLECDVEIKPKKLSSSQIQSLREELPSIQDIADRVACGQSIEHLPYTYARITAQILKEHGVKAKYVCRNSRESVESITSQERAADKDLKGIVVKQRLAICGLCLLFVVFYSLLQIALDNADVWWQPLIIGAVLIVILWFVLRALTKPILKLATKFVDKVFEKNSIKLIDSSTYLRGVILCEVYEEGISLLNDNILSLMNRSSNYYNQYRSYAKRFLPVRIVDGMLPLVIDQMATGADFNTALNHADEKVDRNKLYNLVQNKLTAISQENRRHNIEMECEARQQTRYIEAIKVAEEHRNVLIKENTEAVNRNTKAVKENTRAVNWAGSSITSAVNENTRAVRDKDRSDKENTRQIVDAMHRYY